MCNTRRLEDIVIVMEDCLIKLDNFREAYKNTDDMYVKIQRYNLKIITN